jgi:actin-related protein
VSPDDCPIILAQPLLNSKCTQELILSHFFDCYNVPKFYSGFQPIFNLFSLGQVTGLSVDSGHGLTQIVPVYEGYGLSQGIKNLKLAGQDVTDCLARLIFENGFYLSTTAEMRIAELIKEQNCLLM